MVQEIYQNVEKIIEIFIRKLEEHVRVEKVVLFGSYGRGKPRPWSDIDLAVISPDFEGGTQKDHLLLAKVARMVTPQIEALPYRPEDFHDADPRSFEATILKEGKQVFLRKAA